MSTDIRLPRVSPDDAAVTLIKWHVAVGSRVSPGDVLAEIESDKAMVELEAEDAGVITALCVAEGSDDVHAEQILAVLDETASESEQTTPETPAAAAPVVATPTMANDAPAREDPAARAPRPIALPLAAADPVGDASPLAARPTSPSCPALRRRATSSSTGACPRPSTWPSCATSPPSR